MADIIELDNGKGKATHRYIPRKKRTHDILLAISKISWQHDCICKLCPACREMIQPTAKKKHKDDNQAFKR